MIYFAFLKDEFKTVLALDPAHSGSAATIDKTHTVTQVECVNRGVLYHQ